jgi:hypothetical protein
MKLLDQVIETNADGMGTMRFTQVKKVGTPSLNCYIYRRDRMDGTFFSYEIFMAKQRKKGDKLPNGTVEAEDRERFVTKNDFGFTASETRNLTHAEKLLTDFVQKLNDKANPPVEDEEDEPVMKALVAPKQRGRKRIDRPNLVYPTADKWFMKDLLAANPIWNQPLAYCQLQKDITNGLIVEVDRVRVNAKGKPSVRYKVANSG